MDYHLRPAVPQDLHTVLAWIASPEMLKLWGGPLLTFPPDADRTWGEMGATSENTFSLVDDAGNVAGFGQILPREPGRLHFGRIIVSPVLRGAGLGRILCRSLIETGAACYHATRFTLNVYTQNTPAVRLYQSLGFRIESENAEHHWYSMSLELDTPGSHLSI